MLPSKYKNKIQIHFPFVLVTSKLVRLGTKTTLPNLSVANSNLADFRRFSAGTVVIVAPVPVLQTYAQESAKRKILVRAKLAVSANRSVPAL